MADVALPPGGAYLTWGGQFENLQRAEKRLATVVPVVFLLIGSLLFMALRSGKEAILVFSCVPLALVGGILALLLRGMPFSVSAAVGFIAVSGVATLNGLVLMQAIRERLDAGDLPLQAAINGASSRIRAVLTTALVAIVGFIPMAIASGSGAEVQKPLATVVIGGLITATVLTLLVLRRPLLHGWPSRGRWGELRGGRSPFLGKGIRPRDRVGLPASGRHYPVAVRPSCARRCRPGSAVPAPAAAPSPA